MFMWPLILGVIIGGVLGCSVWYIGKLRVYQVVVCVAVAGFIAWSVYSLKALEEKPDDFLWLLEFAYIEALLIPLLGILIVNVCLAVAGTVLTCGAYKRQEKYAEWAVTAAVACSPVAAVIIWRIASV